MFKLHDLIDERYDIVRPLGQGAMGAVYLATDLVTGGDVAVKALILPPSEHKARFYREFQVMSQLQHPHVINVMAAGEHEGVPYLVMAYVAGSTLLEHFALPPADIPALAARVSLACQIADALGYIHSLGILHRDITPDNVMLEGEHSFLMDFGLAKASDPQWQMLTRVGDVMGTAAYMSPEQIQGQALDARSDLYALGCLLYWLLTAQPPFVGKTLPQLVTAHVEHLPQAPSSVQPRIPPELDTLILRLLAKDPAARYQRADDVLAALRACLRSLATDPATSSVTGVHASTQTATQVSFARTDGETRGREHLQHLQHLHRAPLVGREDVWRVLADALVAFPQQGQVIVLAKAGAGVGATRLLHDLAAQVANVPTLFVRHESSGLLAAWRDALREHAAQVDTSPYARLERYLEPLFVTDPAALSLIPSPREHNAPDDQQVLSALSTHVVTLPSSASLLPSTLTSQGAHQPSYSSATHPTTYAAMYAATYQGQQQLFDAAAQLFLKTPSVLLIDDLDRADEASASLLAHLLESGALSTSLVVLAGRTERLPAVLAKILALEVSGKALITKTSITKTSIEAASIEAASVTKSLIEETSTFPLSAFKRAVQVLPLTPLADDAMRKLLQARLGSPLDATLERYVLRHGHGNPRFTEELLLSLLRTQQISCPQGVWVWDRQVSHVPRSLQDVFRQRLKHLPQRTLATLAAASTLGRKVDEGVLESLCRHYPPAEHARAVLADTASLLAPAHSTRQPASITRQPANHTDTQQTNSQTKSTDNDTTEASDVPATEAARAPHHKRLGVPDERIRDALAADVQRLLQADLLRPSEGGYVFSHPLLQQLLHDALEPAYKRQFHEHLAEYLSRHRRPLPEVLAWHYAEADLPYHAAAHALAAARRAERFFAHDVSESHYRYALSLLPPDSQRAFEAMLALASVLERSGRWQEAEAFYHNVRNSSLRPQALHALGRLHQKRGELLESERYLRQALRLSDDKRPLYSDLGRTLTLKGEFDAAKKVLIRSLRLAENVPDMTPQERARAISQAHVDLAELAIHCGDKTSAQQSLARAQACPNEHSDLHAKIHNLLGVTARMLGRLEEAAAHYRRAAELYESLGDLERGLSVKLNLSNVMADAGDRAAAFAADEAIRMKAIRMGDKKHEAMAAANQGEELLARGDFALAQQRLSQASQLFDGLNYSQYANHVQLNVTLVWLRQGEVVAAKNQLDAVAARMEQASPQQRARFELVSGEYWLMQGQADVAVDLLEQATETLDVLQEVREAIEGYILLVLACVFDSPSDVPDYLARAAELASNLSDPLYKQQVAYVQGRLGDGQQAEAKAWLEQAGYGHFVVRIENILSAL